jgi:hypothetical protein
MLDDTLYWIGCEATVIKGSRQDPIEIHAVRAAGPA